MKYTVSNHKAVAIIGIGCKLPGHAVSPGAFWKLLRDGIDAITEIPSERWDADTFYSQDAGVPYKSASKWGGFTDSYDHFDYAFFGISPREARHLDPQQRWLLEVAWEACEDAGMVPQQMRGGKTGVFIGASSWDYSTIQAKEWRSFDFFTLGGGVLSNLSNRLSYLFDLRGPSCTIDTACSSSLVAVHQACESIRRGGCSMALAGGVNSLILPETMLAFSKAGLLSPTGRCHAFAKQADGYVRGEGAGVVLLKALDTALLDGDHIYAVIRGSAVNQDGFTSSITVPSGIAQEEVLAQAYRHAEVDPSRVSYVEAHGTGTVVGDPIEAAAIAEVLGKHRRSDEPCLIGSVKTNIGHLEPASGIAGLIKVALMLKNRTLVSSLHCEEPNPDIPFDRFNLRVINELTPLPDEAGKILAGINSFGFGGANAHVVLESFCGEPDNVAAPVLIGSATAESSPCTYLLPVSADSPEARVEYLQLFQRFLETNPQVTPQDLCYSAGIKKSHLSYRHGIVGNSVEELIDGLAALLAQPQVQTVKAVNGEARSIIYVFSGQGPQWWGMGRDLLRKDAEFRAFVDECDLIFSRLSGWSIKKQLLADEVHTRLSETQVAQPALFVIQVGLARLLFSWGIVPSAVLGHSLGEVAAACFAGIYSLQDALKIVFHRSRLQQQCHGKGQMVAVALSESAARSVLGSRHGQLEIAAINSPVQVTLAGDNHALATLTQELLEQGVMCRPLGVDYAFHSRHMDHLEAELIEALATIEAMSARMPFYSTVTGGIIDGKEMDAHYWWRNVRLPVRFAEAITASLGSSRTDFLEISPHPVLQRAITETVNDVSICIHPTLQREQSDFGCLFKTVARLYESGLEVDWQSLLGSQGQLDGRFVHLPAYPWQRQPCWKESRRAFETRFPVMLHPLLGVCRRTPLPVWECEIGIQELPYLRDHKVREELLLPASMVVEMTIAAIKSQFPEPTYAIEGLELLRPVALSNRQTVRIQIGLNPETCSFQFNVEEMYCDEISWSPQARGHYRKLAGRPEGVNLKALEERQKSGMEGEQLYRQLSTHGFNFGATFQNVEWVGRLPDGSLGSVTAVAEIASQLNDYMFHPALLDSCFQCLMGVEQVRAIVDKNCLYLPQRIGQFILHRHPVSRLRSWVQLRSATSQSIEADIIIMDEMGERVADVRGLRVVKIAAGASSRKIDEVYRYAWNSIPDDERQHLDHVPVPAASWLIFGDESGLGSAIATELEKSGHTCISVPYGHEVDNATAKALAEILKSTAAEGIALNRVLYLWGLRGNSELHLERLPANALHNTQLLLTVAQTISDTEFHSIENITVVTRGTQTVTGTEKSIDLEAAPLWGSTRVIANEFLQWSCALIDIDPNSGLSDATNLLSELLNTHQPAELAIRAGQHYLPGMRQVDVEMLAYRPIKDATGFIVATSAVGPLDNLYLRECHRIAPRQGELEIEVVAAGLNFRDVLKAMGTYPDDEEADLLLGDECAGRVVRVGTGVKGFAVDDRVIVVTSGALGSHITVAVGCVIDIPDNLSFEAAAGIPIVFLTAWYALVEIARIKAGDRILIHAAAGGVGQAAIQVARLFGAEVFATAGSQQKREFLGSQGVAHVFDSRSLTFVDGIKAATDGVGVDIVLNALAGDYLNAGLSVLAPYGRFVELGKKDIYCGGKLSLDAFKHNISFSAVDLSQILRDQPERAFSMLRKLVAKMNEGLLHPTEFTVFPFDSADTGFRFLAQAKHIGKVVLSRYGIKDDVRVVRESAGFAPENTYLVVGGLGGFGLETIEWLSERGARHIFVLTKTTTPPYSTVIQRVLDRLEKEGTEVVIENGDVAIQSDVRRVIQKIHRLGYPLKGVIHAAMIIDDGFVARMTTERVEKVVNPKVAGAWWLHTETKDRDLDFFVLFSSVSALFGSIGQSNYAAANTFLDALAHYRRRQSLPALSINWGPIGDVGYCARNPDVKAHLEQSVGIECIAAREGLAILGILMEREGEQFGVARFNPEKLQHLFASVRERSRFAAVLDEVQENKMLLPSVAAITSALPENQQQMLIEYVSVQLAEVSGVDLSIIEPDTLLSNVGLDSLMGFELVARVERAFGLSLPGSRMLQSDVDIRRMADIIQAGLEKKK